MSKKVNRRTSNLLLVVGTLFVAVSIISLWQRYDSTNKDTSAPSNSTVIESTPKPSESKPDEDSEFNVPAEQPRRIIIPTIQASGFVQKVGVDQYGDVGVPDNIYFAGWFTESVAPGDEGLSIIDGHVSGEYSDGIFKNLDKLNIDDIFQVEFGDLSLVSFKVVDKLQRPEAKSAEILLEHRQKIPKQLNLITCGGVFDKSTNQYADRQIIISSAI